MLISINFLIFVKIIDNTIMKSTFLLYKVSKLQALAYFLVEFFFDKCRYVISA